MEAAASAVARLGEEPAARVLVKDRDAFAALYEREFDGVFDFVVRVARNRDLAAAIQLKTFARVRDLDDERELYPTARECALDELRYRRRFDWRAEREGLEFTQIDATRLSDPSAVLFDRQLVEIVWDAAGELTAEEFTLFDLYVRRGFTSEEHAGTVARIRQSFDAGVKATLLALRCRHNCPELDRVVAEAEGARTGSAVLSHARACEICRESKRGFVSPTEVFAAFAPVRPSPGLREEIRRQLTPKMKRKPRLRVRV